MQDRSEVQQQGGRQTAVWNEERLLAEAEKYLATGGAVARRGLVRTMLGLERLLGRPS